MSLNPIFDAIDSKARGKYDSLSADELVTLARTHFAQDELLEELFRRWKSNSDAISQIGKGRPLAERLLIEEGKSYG